MGTTPSQVPALPATVLRRFRSEPAWRGQKRRKIPADATITATVRCDSPEATIAADKAQSWAYTEEFLAEDEPTSQARNRAEEFGLRPVSPGVGAALRLVAASLDAHAVAEVGTGTGVSGLWLLAGMRADGVLTTIDVEVEHQRAAKEAFAAAGIRSTRTRAISGRGLEVLQRLADGAYDMVVLDADPAESADYLEQGVRMLRRGGAIAVTDALWHDRVADPARRDEATVQMRELGKTVREDERLLPTLLPVGDGLLVGIKR